MSRLGKQDYALYQFNVGQTVSNLEHKVWGEGLRDLKVGTIGTIIGRRFITKRSKHLPAHLSF